MNGKNQPSKIEENGIDEENLQPKGKDKKNKN